MTFREIATQQYREDGLDEIKNIKKKKNKPEKIDAKLKHKLNEKFRKNGKLYRVKKVTSNMNRDSDNYRVEWFNFDTGKWLKVTNWNNINSILSQVSI